MRVCVYHPSAPHGSAGLRMSDRTNTHPNYVYVIVKTFSPSGNMSIFSNPPSWYSDHEYKYSFINYLRHCEITSNKQHHLLVIRSVTLVKLNGKLSCHFYM